MNRLKTKNGITLIALVVTVVVLLILAVVSISMLTGEDGIVKNAQEAKNRTKEAEEKEQIELAVNSAMADGLGTLKDTALKNRLKENIKNLTDADVTVDETFGWKVKISENEYTIGTDGTVKKVDKSKETVTGLKIGDIINYDPKAELDTTDTNVMEVTSYTTENGNSNQTIKLKEYEGTWRFLGVEDGKLLIMASENVGVSGNSNKFYLKGRTGYQNAENELNKISELFGKGKYAEGARSITVDDINKITGYNPKALGIKNPTSEQIKSADKYGKGELYEYGNEVTYFWNGDEHPTYELKNGEKGTLSNSHNESSYGSGFFWYEGNEWKKSPYTTTRGKITSLTSNYYWYYPETLTQSSDNTATIGIANSSPEYIMLFGNSSNQCYWLASKSVATVTEYAFCSVRVVVDGCVGGNYVAVSTGYEDRGNYGVRPVVFLKSDVTLEKDGSGIWQFK